MKSTLTLVLVLIIQPVLAQVDVDEDNEFDGIDQSATDPDDVPGDPDLAVGHDIIIQVVNRWMRMWARDENGDWTVVGNADLTSFFESVERDATDPSVIFDPASERLIVSGTSRYSARVIGHSPIRWHAVLRARAWGVACALQERSVG
jgi:hypothetical protein